MNINMNEDRVQVERSQIVTSRIDGGFTWTLASRLGDLLSLAEERFGERDLTYTLLGIEFYERGPQIWFPGFKRNIIIQLGLLCLTKTQQACYQLAHECVHLLSPTGQLAGNVLEEGLATLFSEDYMAQTFPGSGWHAVDQKYADAAALARQLLAIDGNAIKTLRKTQPTISLITADQIRQHCPELPEETAAALGAPFVYRLD